MNFKDILEENDKSHRVYIGYDGRKEKEFIDIKENPTTVITGETGSGKSVLLNQILCQLIKNNTSLDMEFVFIDSGGLELRPYVESRFDKKETDEEDNKEADELEENFISLSAMHDNDAAQELIYRIKENLEERHEFIKNAGCSTVDEYNKTVDQEDKIPDLVLAIDDNGTLICEDGVNKLLVDIIDLAKDVNFYMFASFSNTDNIFFKNNENLYFDIRISFDMSDDEHEGLINIKDSADLPGGKFTLSKEKKDKDLFNFEFDDKIIIETLNK